MNKTSDTTPSDGTLVVLYHEFHGAACARWKEAEQVWDLIGGGVYERNHYSHWVEAPFG